MQITYTISKYKNPLNEKMLDTKVTHRVIPLT